MTIGHSGAAAAAPWKRRSERAVQQDGGDGRELRIGGGRLGERRRDSSRLRSAAERSASTTVGSRRPRASTMRAWISGSGSGPSGGTSTGRRRWKTFFGKSKLKNVASNFSYWVAAAARSPSASPSRS